jgi:hypothetical protein
MKEKPVWLEQVLAPFAAQVSAMGGMEGVDRKREVLRRCVFTAKS